MAGTAREGASRAGRYEAMGDVVQTLSSAWWRGAPRDRRSSRAETDTLGGRAKGQYVWNGMVWSSLPTLPNKRVYTGRPRRQPAARSVFPSRMKRVLGCVRIQP
jgi:hypothetical protein